MSESVKIEKFRPLELNESNVSKLYKRCLADESELNNLNLYYTSQVLKPTYTGRSSEIVKLSKEKVNANTQTIQFLLGQIKNFHSTSTAIALQEGFLKYDNTIWTQNYDTLFQLYHLALSNASISDFVLSGNVIGATKSPSCIPTISPKDPNYQEWFSGYEAKVKKKTLGGQEPADD